MGQAMFIVRVYDAMQCNAMKFYGKVLNFHQTPELKFARPAPTSIKGATIYLHQLDLQDSAG